MLKRYVAPMIIFIISMIGIVVADNLLVLFLFWELTSLSSFFLIGLERERQTARHSAQMALLVTGAGGLCLLVGSLILGHLAGTYEISQILERAAEFRDHPMLLSVFLLFALAAFTKSAQFPFHFWLPNAMAAPAPVSAYLHSATMVKAGIYLLARFFPLFASLDEWSPLLIGAGGITFIWGAWVAVHKNDLKALLANSTISALGLIFVCLGLGTSEALNAGLVFLVAHALYKAPLFLWAGVVEKKLGTRDLRELAGLGWQVPGLAAIAGLATLSMAGVPPFFGFVSKELIYTASLEHNVLLAILFLGAALTVTAAVRLGYLPFWKPSEVTTKVQQRPGVALLWVPMVLATAGFLLAAFTSTFGEVMIDPALLAMGSANSASGLFLWHGLTPVLGLSFLTLVFGFLIARYHSAVETFGTRHFFEGDAIYERSLRATLRLGRGLTAITQTGSLSYYLSFTAITLLVSLIVAGQWTEALRFDLFSSTSERLNPYQASSELLGIFLCILICGFALLATMARQGLTSVLAMGGIGFAIAVFYGFFGAPDLALTQFSVECLALLLMVLVLPSMPPFQRWTKEWVRHFHLLASVIFGAVFSIFVLVGFLKGHDSHLTPFFGDHSWVVAKGRNVVNVILVDFRGLDTMGEITVLVIAALGIVVLLGGFKKAKKEDT